MGNKVDTGFHEPPPKYLKEIRKKTDRRLRMLAAKRRSSAGRTNLQKEKDEKVEENSKKLTATSVKKYVINNPGFLDDLVVNHISSMRIQAWMTASKKKKEDPKGKRRMTDKDEEFTAELFARSIRQREILMLTRMRLRYPNPLKKSDLEELLERHKTDKFDDAVESHLFPYMEIQSEDIGKVFFCMCTKLFGKYAFPMPELCYFLVAMKSNYNAVEYHNFHHALSHAQSMYWILRNNPGVFDELEMKCLMVSAISHDAGHPGVNEDYLRKVGSGLEKLYRSPVLENHHIQTTFLILQDINCNIFKDLSSSDYYQVLGDIEHCILSTSLKRYKSQNENMRHIIAIDLNFETQHVRDAIKSALMMTCDLCSGWKAWQDHKNALWALYKEFFSQGDKEQILNLKPIPFMLRDNADSIPNFQIDFLENVAIPIFQMAAKVFPNIQCIVDSTEENLEIWKTYL